MKPMIKILTKHITNEDSLYLLLNEIREDSKNIILDIYELEQILGVSLDDKSVDILTKFIMWRYGITEEEFK